MHNFEIVKSKIELSDISPEDKKELTDIFSEIPDEYLKDLVDLLNKDASWISKLNDNRKKKQEAFATGNRELWGQILEEEKTYLGDRTFDRD